MSASVKRAISNLMKRLGYTVIPNWRVDHYPVAIFLRKLLSLLEIDCVLDIGANLGQYRDFLRMEVGYTGVIVSIEPILSHVLAMRFRAKKETKWVVESYALGNAGGRAKFNVMTNTKFSSFLEPDHSEVLLFRGQNEISNRVDVEMKTLDEVLPGLEKDLGVRNFYLKLDTQGFDLEVAKGASKNLTRIRGLQTEASVRPIYKGIPDYATTIQTFQSQGFEVSGFFPTNPEQFPHLIDFDCFMINKKYLPTKKTDLRSRALENGRANSNLND